MDKLIQHMSYQMNEQMDSIMQTWITNNLDEINCHVEQKVYKVEDVIKRLQEYESVKNANEKLNKIQLDSQLTVEELHWLQVLLMCEDNDETNRTIYEKLQMQKEMLSND
ncbi:MAG: hypothetical protein RR585_01840 [Coprobacillus sp.]